MKPFFTFILLAGIAIAATAQQIQPHTEGPDPYYQIYGAITLEAGAYSSDEHDRLNAALQVSAGALIADALDLSYTLSADIWDGRRAYGHQIRATGMYELKPNLLYLAGDFELNWLKNLERPEGSRQYWTEGIQNGISAIIRNGRAILSARFYYDYTQGTKGYEIAVKYRHPLYRSNDIY